MQRDATSGDPPAYLMSYTMEAALLTCLNPHSSTTFVLLLSDSGGNSAVSFFQSQSVDAKIAKMVLFPQPLLGKIIPVDEYGS